MMLEEAIMSTITTPPALTALPLLIPDVNVSADMIEDRRARGVDHHDEVWEGVYVMSPAANNEHQKLIARLTSILIEVVDEAGLGESFPGVNVSDQQDNWQKNLRCPDVVAFLNGNPAQNRDTHRLGGPDFAIEIVSPYDRSREKLDFYARIGTRELLIIDRDPWQLELLRLADGKLGSAGVSTLDKPAPLTSETTHLAFCLAPGDKRPVIAVTHADDGRQWTA
jgi:Uma2 family endonuclease